MRKIILTLLIIYTHLICGISQESILKNNFNLMLSSSLSEIGDSILTFEITNNSMDSIMIEPPGNGISSIVYVFPNQEELEDATISCNFYGEPETKNYLLPRDSQIFIVPKEHIQIMLNPYQKKFGPNATYQVYWKVYDGNFLRETVYGKNGRKRVDRTPTYLRSNAIEITL